MPFISWDESFSVDVKSCDSQHRELVDMVNELNRKMQGGAAREVLGEFVSGLISHTAVHFGDEERLMKDFGYPGMAAHKEEHERLVGHALVVQEEFTSGKEVLTWVLMAFLKEWLLHHIQNDDRELGRFLNEKGVY